MKDYPIKEIEEYYYAIQRTLAHLEPLIREAQKLEHNNFSPILENIYDRLRLILSEVEGVRASLYNVTHPELWYPEHKDTKHKDINE